jgi:hypothetical protein
MAVSAVAAYITDDIKGDGNAGLRHRTGLSRQLGHGRLIYYLEPEDAAQSEHGEVHRHASSEFGNLSKVSFGGGREGEDSRSNVSIAN